MPLFRKSVPCEKCGAPIVQKSFRLQSLQCPECRDVRAEVIGWLTFLLAVSAGIAAGVAVATLLPLIFSGVNLGILRPVLAFIAGFDTAGIIAWASHHRATDEDPYARKARVDVAVRFGITALLCSRGLDLEWRGSLVIANVWIGYLTVPRAVDWVRQRKAVAEARRAEINSPVWSAPEFDESARVRSESR